jgi:crossover junction endodeoxyribonuclease RusA
VTFIKHDPRYRIWVPGAPRSAQGGSRTRYVEGIRAAAREVVRTVLRTGRIDLEVWFVSDSGVRPDVDNVLKPIMDALKGVVYEDDRQVRSVRVVALPSDDAYGIAGSTPVDVLARLGADDEFLINVYVGRTIGGLGP